jgi:hypothetical protein
MLPEFTLLRLEKQLEVVPLLLGGASAEEMMARSASGDWSPHENLAHLARHHAVFLERLQRIIAEDAPELTRYRAEKDSTWGEWTSLTTDEVISRLHTLRAEIVEFIKRLSDAESNRVGIHPLFGQMDLTQWVEFFLLHEAHHLYKVMIRLGETKRARGKDENR